MLQTDSFWKSYLTSPEKNDIAVHVAILSKNYLQKILRQEKTIESRFSIHRRPPFGQVRIGDVICLKASGGPILGLAYVTKVWSFKVNPEIYQQIQNDFARELQIADDAFWETRKLSNYATLLRLAHVQAIAPVPFPKRDQRAWIVYSSQPRLPLAETGC